MSEVFISSLASAVLGACIGVWLDRRRRPAPAVDIVVDWELIRSALEGSGYTAVPKDKSARTDLRH